MSARFDQKDLETNPYGKCKTCDIGFLQTEDIANTHMREQRHTISVLNMTRQDRIDTHVYEAVVDGIERVCDRLYGLAEDGELTVTEITEAMRSAPDPGDEWDAYLGEMEE